MAKILIADDSIFQRANLRYLLKLREHEILEAGNGQQALELAAVHAPDCIILDVIMPQMSGPEVLETLRARHNQIPVIVLTADIQSSTQQHCLALGAVEVVEKPVDGERFLALIDRLLEGR